MAQVKGTLKRLMALCSLLALVVLAGCSGGGSPSNQSSPQKPSSSTSQTSQPAAPAKTIKLGALLPLTGPLSPMANHQLRGMKWAVDQINAAGGIKALGGAKFELVNLDFGAKTDVAVSMAEKLIQEHQALVLYGALHGPSTFATSQVAERNKTPYIAPVDISTELTARGFKYYWSMNGNSDHWGETQFAFLEELNKRAGGKYKRVAAVYVDDPYGQAMIKAQKGSLQKAGYELVAEVVYPLGLTDASPYVSKLKAARPDILVQTSYFSDAVLFTKAYDLAGLKVPLIASGAGFSDPGFGKEMGAIADRIFTVHGWNGDIPGADKTIGEWKKTYPDNPPTVHAMLGYQAVQLTATALEKSGTADREALKDALNQVDLKASDLVVPFKGIKFDDTGYNAKARAIVTQWQGGQLVTVFPEDVAGGKPKL